VVASESFLTATYRSITARQTVHVMIGGSRGGVPRKLGLVQRKFFLKRPGDARSFLQALVVGFDGRPRREIDLRRHRPVQHGVEIRVCDAKTVEQEFAAGEVAIEIVQARIIFFQRVCPCPFRRLLVEQRNKEALVQFRADETQPLLQARAFGVVARRPEDVARR